MTRGEDSPAATARPVAQHVALIGLGLIASSIARGLRKRGAVRRLSGFDADETVRARAGELGLLDDVAGSVEAAVAGADIVILCVPSGAMGAVAGSVIPAMKPGAILTDTGSVKGAIVDAVRPHVAASDDRVHFVPGHPIAGSEKSGPDAGWAELFEGRWCILTPDQATDPAALDTVAQLWRALGSNIEIMEVAHHDLVLAITSHLPHLIAYSIVDTAAGLEEDIKAEVIRFSAGGFRDFTRLAGSDPVMWRDVFLNNREATLEMLGRFTEDLTALQKAIRKGDGAALEVLFTRTRDIRRSIIEAKQA